MKIVEFIPFENTNGRVTAYLHSPITEMEIHRTQFPVMVICPGGGYNFCSQRESDPVAFEYLAAGYNVFILRYSVGDKAKDLVPLKELSSTIMKIRENAQLWNCDSDKIAVCGFSAGGHLTASIATLWNNPTLLETFDNKNGLNKPNAVILSYAVVSGDPEIYHGGSIKRACGIAFEKALDLISPEEKERQLFFSLDRQVTSDCPPAFVWHTVEDDVVPVENSLRFIMSLQKNNISYEAHIFPTGRHGISVCTKEVETLEEHNRQWVELSKKWLGKTFDYKL